MAAGTQGSRGALVTWTVVTSILFVTATVFAIYFWVDADKSRKDLDSITAQYREIVPGGSLSGTDVSDLKAKRGDAEGLFPNGMSVLDVSTTQTKALAQKIAGAGKGYDDAVAAFSATWKQASERAKASGMTAALPDSLTGAVDALSSQLQARANEVNDLKQQLAAAQKTVTDKIAEMDAAKAALDKQLSEVRASADATTVDANNDRASKDEQVKKLQSDFEATQKGLQEQVDQAQASIQDLTKKLDQTKRDNDQLRGRLAEGRVDSTSSVVRQADGHIIRVSGSNTCYIDLGQGDQISPGLTFQVFDRLEGIPQAGDPTTDENLPRGKGSIEVVRVGAGSSECRVIRMQPGQQLVEGDLVVNVVYDKNTQYNFLVYGQFDLDQNGVATAQDAEVVKRLVGQWGGKLTDKVNVDTDFVILGKEPVVPSFTKEELEDTINKAKFDEAVAAVEAYDEVRKIASDLHIPILNQNRFLYFVGFFEMAKR